MPAYRVQVNLVGLGGLPGLATHYFDSSVIPNAQAAVDVVEVFWAAVGPFMDDGIGMESLPEVALFASPLSVTSFSVTTPFLLTGSNASEPLPQFTQALVTWRTSTLNGNKRVLGRTFVPGMCENANGGSGTPSGALVDAFLAAGANMAADGLVVASRALDAFAPVTGVTVPASWSVLSSRRS